MLDKLTKEQKDLIPIILDKWIRKAITPTMRPVSTIQNNIKELYEMANIEPVPVIVCTSLKEWQQELDKFLKSSLQKSARLMWHTLWKSLSKSVRLLVGQSVAELLWGKINQSVGRSVWADGELLCKSVDKLMWQLVGRSVNQSVNQSVGGPLQQLLYKIVDKSFDKWTWLLAGRDGRLVDQSTNQLVGMYYWAEDFARYDYWKTIGVYTDKENIAKIEKYIDLLSDCSYGFITDKIAIVLTKPVVHVDENWMLHNTEDKALIWSDGDGKYYLHGVEFDENLFKKVTSGEMPFEEILAIEDIDQRTQAMRFGDPEAFFKHANAKQLDTYQKKTLDGKEVNYVLWKVPKGDIFQTDVYFMMYNCPSTGKQYMSGVPKFKTVPEAMAWKQSDDWHTVTPEQWKQMVPLIHES